VLAVGVFIAGHVAAGEKQPLAGIAIAVGSAVIAGVCGFMLMRVTATLGVWRMSASNLIAVRENAVEEPRVWLVAHLDSKSQTIGMLVRVASLMTAALLLILTIAAMIWQAAVMSDELAMMRSAYLAMFTALAMLPFTFCFVTNKSRGALDNASGVAAALLAVEALSRDRSVGVLISSAEELGLAGAHAFAERRPRPGIAINCDTVDRSGSFVCMTSGSGRAARSAIVRGAVAVGQRVKVRDTIPGILTDSVALARAGWDTCTLSRGNLGTLRRVHTSGDEPGRVNGAGIALAARILAATVEELA
jgi:hypothetical protein